MLSFIYLHLFIFPPYSTASFFSLRRVSLYNILTVIHPQLQDREVLVSLLVGAKYGMSQVINHKLNMISTLVEFSSISRVELLSESDKVSLLRISLHDMKVRKTLQILDSIIHKHVGIHTLTQIHKKDSPHTI